MSEFDDAVSEMHAEAREVIGEERFTVTLLPIADGVKLNVSGILDELATSEELTLNGRQVTFDAMLQVAISEFRNQQPVAGQRYLRQKTGKTYRLVGEVHRDALTYTFPLETVHQ